MLVEGMVRHKSLATHLAPEIEMIVSFKNIINTADIFPPQSVYQLYNNHKGANSMFTHSNGLSPRCSRSCASSEALYLSILPQ